MTEDLKLGKEIRNAIKNGNAEMVVLLLGSNKERLEMMTPFGTWLHVAAAHNQLEIVKRLIALGADVNKKGGILGGTPLNEAASEGHIQIVEYLLSSGAHMDVSDPRTNPLFGAIYAGHTDVAKLLVENGIDTHVTYTGKNMENMDALAYAQEWGRAEIARFLSTWNTSRGNCG